jgi:uncharacterized RDD family membrane protein YckC
MNAIAHASAPSTTGPQLDNRRVLAALIDLVVVGAGAALILLAADALPNGSGSARDEIGSGLYLITLAWALYYYFACESGGGQTLGKRVMKLRVVRADGGEAGMGEIAVRTILRVVDGIGLYVVGLIAMLASGNRRQRLGDMAGGTIVVDAHQALEPARPESAAPVPAGPPAASVTTVALPEVQEPVVAPEEPVVALDEPVAIEPEPADPLTPFQPILREDAQPQVADEAPFEEPQPVVEEPQPVVEEPQPVVEEPQPVVEEPQTDAPVVVRSVETVSAIDLVMGADDGRQDPPAAPAGR